MVMVICSLEDEEQRVRGKVVRVQNTSEPTQQRGASLPMLRYHVKMPRLVALRSSALHKNYLFTNSLLYVFETTDYRYQLVTWYH